MRPERYPTDLTDDEWAVVSKLFTKSEHRGAQRKHDLRRIIDGCLYVLRGGIAWRMMPHDLPPWTDVYDHFRRWRKSGKWEQVNAALREQYRTRRGRKAQPTAAAIDSQSVKTTESGGPRGYDGGKKISGRKRQTLVDTEGDVLKVRVHPADLHDKA
ncbi:IS5 family transposase, partial [Azospirillum argentinense]